VPIDRRIAKSSIVSESSLRLELSSELVRVFSYQRENSNVPAMAVLGSLLATSKFTSLCLSSSALQLFGVALLPIYALFRPGEASRLGEFASSHSLSCRMSQL